MILIMDNGNQIRGDLIHQATLRSSLLPIPLTLEVSLRVDDSIQAQLKQGKMLTLGSGEQMQIIDSRFARNQVAQDEKQQSVMALTAILDAVAPWHLCVGLPFWRKTHHWSRLTVPLVAG